MTHCPIQEIEPNAYRVALAGNPNVGKSTVFNGLTGLKQHTGNWPGKTVTYAEGQYSYLGKVYNLIDLPGTYSLMAHSKEEEVARDFLCLKEPDAIIVVCDATYLERNLNLTLQILEISSKVVICVNLLDEAEKKNIQVDLDKLSKILGVPVVGTTARSMKGLERLIQEVSIQISKKEESLPIKVNYIPSIERAIACIQPLIALGDTLPAPARWFAIRLLEDSETFLPLIAPYLKEEYCQIPQLEAKLEEAKSLLCEEQISTQELKDQIVISLIATAEAIAHQVVKYHLKARYKDDRKIDKILTSKYTGIPIMLLLLGIIFWITLFGANYVSDILFGFFYRLEVHLLNVLQICGSPMWLEEVLINGIYRVLTWVISVMLPPMAIFFPLFTYLEDLGYLPRVAFNLDKPFKKCCACGKQALTMCMGFGCNAVGVEGCRIIDSPRERLIAILTNSFVPCNGRFPTLIIIISMFFVGSGLSPFTSLLSTILLMAIIILGILLTFATSWVLSKTILKGIPSAFTLELPPYRKPQIGKILIRSFLDRTLFVLKRAVLVAAPAGLVIWILANVTIGDTTLITYFADFLNPFAEAIGLDGIILMAFILGLPANEIVLPIMIMAYMSTGHIVTLHETAEIKALLISNGWTPIKALCTLLFFLMHWPCSTTLLTIKKETQSLKWAAIGFLLPTAMGMLLCFLIANMSRVFF